MDKKELFIEKELSELCNAFKSTAILSILLIEERDFDTIYQCHKKLVKIYENILDFIKKNCSKKIYNLVEEEEFDKLPEYLDYVKIANTYKKMVAKKYYGNATEHKKTKERVMMSKMSLELETNQEGPYICIANALYKDKKYAEAIKIFSFFEEYTNLAPTLEIMGKTYEKAKKYDMALECYSRLLSIYQYSGSENAMKRLYSRIFSR